MKLSISIATHIGKIRENNEDNFYSSFIGATREKNIECYFQEKCSAASRIFFGVFDGIGSLCGSEDASKAAADKLRELALTGHPGTIPEYIDILNQAVCQEMDTHYKKIGTTAVILSFDRKKFEMANVGDSKCFLMRKNKLEQISEDHTEAEFMKKLEGRIEIGPNLAYHKLSSTLTQYLGITEDEFKIEPYLRTGKPKKGDIFLLCSDGLSGMLSYDELSSELSKKASVKEKGDALLEKALENGGKDNITFILIQIN